MHKNKTQGRDWNEGHPDHEGEMAVAQLHRIAEMAKEMLEMIGENDDLPGWIQYKITRSFNDIGDAYNYTEAQYHMDEECDDDEHEEDEYEEDDSFEDEGTIQMKIEGRSKKKGLWYNIHKRRKSGKRAKRPGEKGYPKTLKIESVSSLRNLILNELRRTR